MLHADTFTDPAGASSLQGLTVSALNAIPVCLVKALIYKLSSLEQQQAVPHMHAIDESK